MAALCASVAEELLPDENLVTTRLTLDFFRPVPRAPLQVAAQTLKAGRRVSLVKIDLRERDDWIAHALVQRVAQSPMELPSLEGTGAELIPPTDSPESFPPMDLSFAPKKPAPFARLASDLRTSRPEGIYGREPVEAWIRVHAHLLPGVPLSTSAAVMAAADYGNALGAPEPPGTATRFPNADLTVHLARRPDEAWVRMAPSSTWLEHGIGHTRCLLADRRGMLGTSTVTLPLSYLAERAK